MSQRCAVFFVMCLWLSNAVYYSQQTELVNVALGKPTRHSSTHRGQVSDLANDGKRETFWSYCTHTESTGNNFWIVDLFYSYPIHTIYITNRDILNERLSDFDIYVSDINPMPIQDGNLVGELCLHHTGHLARNGPHSLQCRSQDTRGRYVYVWKPIPEALTICEFEVLVEKRQLIMNRMGFFVYPGKRSGKASFFSATMKAFSRLNCVRLCLSSSAGLATLVQMEEERLMCECVEESGLEESSVVISAEGWKLIKYIGN